MRAMVHARTTRTAAAAGLAAIATASFLVATAFAAFPGENGEIAYTLYHHPFALSKQIIHAVSPGGARDRTLASGFDPSWSADGTPIAFARTLGDCAQDTRGACESDLFTMRADGSDQRRLTQTSWSESDPSYSPNGRRIVFTRTIGGDLSNPRSNIVSVRSADGSDPRVLVRTKQWFSGFPGSTQPEYSPDGRHIVYYGASYPAKPGIYTMHPDGSHKRLLARVSANDGFYVGNPDYSPDGRHIVFQRPVKRWGIDGTVVMRSDGSHRKPLPQGGLIRPVYSPNGGRFAATYSNDIYTLRAHFTEPVDNDMLPATMYGEDDFATEPSWQPLPSG